jgi:hypothetical protein
MLYFSILLHCTDLTKAPEVISERYTSFELKCYAKISNSFSVSGNISVGLDKIWRVSKLESKGVQLITDYNTIDCGFMEVVQHY